MFVCLVLVFEIGFLFFSPGWPGSHFVDQADLTEIYICLLSGEIKGIMHHHHHLAHNIFLMLNFFSLFLFPSFCVVLDISYWVCPLISMLASVFCQVYTKAGVSWVTDQSLTLSTLAHTSADCILQTPLPLR